MKDTSIRFRVLLDVRCLQDPDYAWRGVGRHALALLQGAPGGIRLEGLIDRDLPPLMGEAQAALAAVHPNAYAATTPMPPDGFVCLSPMTHDPLFAARLLSDDRVRRIAVVYDFIPHREPARYLPGATDRLRYAAGLRWLKRCQLFAPISQSAADDLVGLLDVPRHAVSITGAPVAGVFERAGELRMGRPARHILVVGGGDPRKNPEVVVRAHARSGALQREGVPLVLAGSYGPGEAAAFRDLALAAGGRADLVEVPGHVCEAALLEIYALAYAIICPSRDEGFSLPAVEGMAAGLPCLASDIPAQRELVGDPALRFAPDDEAALTPMLERVVTDADWRTAILRSQAKIWPRFRAQEVAGRFWNTVIARLRMDRPAPAVLRGRKPRVAVLSPVPPDRSGCADYTGASCGPLGRLVDLHIFTEAAEPKPLSNVATVRPLVALPHLMPSFDRVISVIGNSHFHLRIFEYLLRYGGACIAHDSRMLGFYRVLLGVERACAVASQEVGRPVSETELHKWLADENTAEVLLLGEITANAAPMFVHSPVTQRLVEERHRVRPHYLPFSIYRPWSPEELTPERRRAARERLGLPNGEAVIATFGFVHGTKAPEECIWALENLRGWGVPASLHFVGTSGLMSPVESRRLRALVAELGLRDHVHFAAGDYVPEETYRDYLAAADLGIQVRTYGFGSISGALIDCVAAGLPTVANIGLAEAVGVPVSYVRAVPDALSPPLMAEALADLWDLSADSARREAERAAYSRARDFHSYSRRLCEGLGLDVAAVRAEAA